MATDEGPDGGASDAGRDTDVAKVTDVLRSKLTECAELDAPVPRTIRDVVSLINRMPAPTSVPCLVASLPRPLSLVASSSISSLQPANGTKSPRLIIMYEQLLLTVVPTGEGASALELGEWMTPRRTLKGELHFPVAQPITQDLPYSGLTVDGPTSTPCRFCHADEQQHATIPGAFVSDAFRPLRAYEVSAESVRALRKACDEPGGVGPHCLMLVALFDFGEVRQGIFAEQVMEGF